MNNIMNKFNQQIIETYNMQQSILQINKSSILLTLYSILIILFLHSQFQTAYQSKQISNLKFINQSLNITKQHNQYIQTTYQDNKRVILLLVDAAKYNYSYEFNIIKQLLHTKQKNSVLKKVIVSEPTMTTQKIQTLMTGSEIFSTSSILDSFFSNSVQTDNIIKQLQISHKKVVTMGDDTWGKLFTYQKQYPCTTTFDIWDWQTCDQIIYKNLANQLAQLNSLVIAHFLALDHIGHSTSSTNDPNFGIMKLRFSEFFQKIINNMKDGDLLLITGDHGMRQDGNHGGSSQAQTQTFLFAYSPKYQLQILNNSPQIYQPDITTIPKNSIGIPFLLTRSQTSKQQSQNQIIKVLQKHFQNLIDSSSNMKCQQFNRKQSINNFQYFKDIQKNCLKQLNHSEPNNLPIFLSLFGMSIIVIIYIIKSEIELLGLIIIICFSTAHSFSWYLIQNSSSYYLILFILLVMFCYQLNQLQKVKILGFLLFMSQIQPMKPGDYNTNILKSQFISNIIFNQITQILLLISVGIVLGYKALTNNHKKQYIIVYFVVVITFLNIILQNILLQDINQIVICLNYVISISCLFGYVYYKILSNSQQQNNMQLLILILCFLQIFSNRYYGLILFCFCFIYSYISNVKHIKPVLGWVFAEYTWWVLGNRYQYSSFDIKQSYVFSQSYYSTLNPICLIINSLLPYILALILQSNYQITIKNIPIKLSSNDDKQTIINNENINVEQNINRLKLADFSSFVIKPMIWLIFGAINLIYNNGKILFTVVYVPMYIIQSGKFFFIISLIVIHSSYLRTKK